MNPGDVRRAQLALIRLGYDIGAADDDLGLRTLSGMMALVAGRRISDSLRADAGHLLAFMVRYGIIGRYRIAHFLANLSHESAGFTRRVENLSYSDAAHLLSTFPSRIKSLSDATALCRAGAVAIGNRVYAGKNGNGDEASGDGYRYRGRGWIQITGRANYAAMVSPTGLDLLGSPQLIERSDVAAHAACLFWDARNLNLMADRDDARAVRRAINGEAMLGLNDCTKGASKISALFHP